MAFSYKSIKLSTRIFLVVVVIIAVAGAAYFMFVREDSAPKAASSSNIDYSPAKKSDNAANEERKNSANTNKEGGAASTLDGSNSSPSFSASITGVNVDPDSKTVYTGTLVTGVISGHCTLTFTKSGQAPISLQNDVVLQNNNYVCPVFSLPTSQFPATGTWQVALQVVNGDSIASDTKQVTIN